MVDIFGILNCLGGNSTVSEILSALVFFNVLYMAYVVLLIGYRIVY